MYKQKSKSKSHRWGAWSEWAWDSTEQAYLRSRQDSEGNRVWDKRYPNPPSNAQTPREAPVEDITERLNSLSPGATEAQSGEYPYASGLPDEHLYAGGLPDEHSYAGGLPDEHSYASGLPDEHSYAGGLPDEPKSKHGKSRMKEKGRSHRSSHRHQAISSEPSSATHQEDLIYDNAGASLSYAAANYGAKYQQAGSVNYSQTGTVQDIYSNEPSFENRYAGYEQEREGSSSRAAATAAESIAAGSIAAQMYYEDPAEASMSAYAKGHSVSERLPTSPAENATEKDSISAHAKSEPAEREPKYRQEHSSKFDPGAIFKVRWPEPQGSKSESTRSKSSSKKQDIQNNQEGEFYLGVRRFIVVANDQGHCTCVPISTYGNQGCKKPGCKPDKHGIVFERGQPAMRLDGEPPLGFAPVCAELTEKNETISRESRVNYSKLVTIEHNVKVFFIGHIYGNDCQIVTEAVDSCWGQKKKNQRRK